MTKMRRIFQHGESYYTAVHMRVEDDWLHYCQANERKSKINSKWCFGADEIANITLATEEVRGHHNFLLMYAADRFDPMHKLRTPDNMKTDPMKVRIPPLSPCQRSDMSNAAPLASVFRRALFDQSSPSFSGLFLFVWQVWPPDVKTANPIHMGCFDQDPGSKPLSYTERSVVSLFLAADADTFVGTVKSTFFIGVTMIRGLSRPFTGHSYTYDGDAPEYKQALEYRPGKYKRPTLWPTN